MQADFEGFYSRFETKSKKDAGVLMGADTLVGDEFTIRFDSNSSLAKALIFNKFDKEVGYFEEATSRQLRLIQARGWKLHVVLSYLVYSDHPEPGCYWGQMAIMSYPAECEELFAPFVEKAKEKIADGTRVDVNIGSNGVKSIVESNGSWFTIAVLPKPEFDKGTVMMKSSRSLSEKLIEQGRARNIGCYIVSWAFIILMIAGIAFGLKSCGIF
jgi:hypothetical protein